MRCLSVESCDGPDAARLAVRVHEPSGHRRADAPVSGGVPTVVLVHGYPDTQSVCDGVVGRLAARHRA